MVDERLEQILEKIEFQPLKDQFEAFSDEQKQALYDFDSRFPDYLTGCGNSGAINSLVAREKKVETEHEQLLKAIAVTQFAQMTRWAHQLLMIYDFYVENDMNNGVLFNKTYISDNPCVNEGFGNMGYNLLQALRRNQVHTLHAVIDPLDNLIPIVASVRPDIVRDYIGFVSDF
jgi:hypothetical protein